MPSININFLKSLKCNISDFNNFIETGTHMGQTILYMEPYFNNLYTIEIKESFYKHITDNYKGNKINFYLGDSSHVLVDILPNINGKSIFFLDGHWSAGNTGKGIKDCPLYEELNHIILQHKDQAIIIVDDVRMFGKGPNKGTDLCDWEDINIQGVLDIVQSRITQHYFLPSSFDKNDRLIIHLSHS